MRVTPYSTRMTDTVRAAVSRNAEYFGGNATLSPVLMSPRIETKSSVYEKALSWAMDRLRMTKSISTEYLTSLDPMGADCVVLFVDKDRAKETSSLYGQHAVRGGVSYVEIYDTDLHARIDKDKSSYVERYVDRSEGSVGEATEHALRHELFHALSAHHGIDDILHAFISEGQFDSYLHYLQVNIANQMKTRSEELYLTAVSKLWTDVTPKDEVPDNVACAAGVNAVHRTAFGDEIGGGASTYWLYDALTKRRDFERVDAPQRGDVIISPSGYGNAKLVSNGHVGIVGDGDSIMSNTSADGLWKSNYTLETWRAYYGTKGKYPIYYFRKK